VLRSYKVGRTRTALAMILSRRFHCYVAPALLVVNKEGMERDRDLGFNPRAWSWYYDAGSYDHPLYECGSAQPMGQFVKLARRPGCAICRQGHDLFALPEAKVELG
jgi:hypothetical protein